MADERPSVIVLAGPNGSGKTTSAPKLLRDVLGVAEFVNADTIAGARGLQPGIGRLGGGRNSASRYTFWPSSGGRLLSRRRSPDVRFAVARPTCRIWL